MRADMKEHLMLFGGLMLLLSACNSSAVCSCPLGVGNVLIPADIRSSVAEVTAVEARCNATYDAAAGAVFVTVVPPISSGSIVTCSVRVRLDSGAVLVASVAFAAGTGCCAGTEVSVVDGSALEYFDAGTDQ